MMMKLQGLAVSSSKGTHGGYFYSGDGVTIGQIINKLGLTEDVPETVFSERLKTQMNRITRLKIEEFEEFDE
jgi:hypothetical protein